MDKRKFGLVSIQGRRSNVKPRLQELYFTTLVPALQKQFGYANKFEVPIIEKIVINMGLGEAIANPKAIENASHDLGLITGQKALVTKAKKSVANFKLREGQAIGLKVTLRGVRMYEFLDRMVNAVLPRIRDFRGIPEDAFDQAGNYNFGLKDYMVFPELIYDEVDKPRPMQITIVIRSKGKDASLGLLKSMGFPLKKL